MKNSEILSSVKDQDLVKKRRDQMIEAAITLFKEKGFHRTTTREIAKESGFSIGTLYEYIRKKEDVLFLVCDSIYEEVQERLESAMYLENPSMELAKDKTGKLLASTIVELLTKTASRANQTNSLKFLKAK